MSPCLITTSLSMVENAVALTLSNETPTTLSNIAACCNKLIPRFCLSDGHAAGSRQGFHEIRMSKAAPAERQFGVGGAAERDLVCADSLQRRSDL